MEQPVEGETYLTPIRICEKKMRVLLVKRKNCLNKFTVLLFVIFFLWIILQFIAPLALPTGSVPDLSGVVAYADNEKTIETMGFPWDALYASGDRLCHQQADRSLFINGNEMPFCSRCTAIWVGLVLGVGLMIFFTIELNIKFLILIFIGLVPIAVDGGGQLLGFWESTNIIRIATGLLAGGVGGVSIGVIIDEIKDIIPLKNKK